MIKFFTAVIIGLAAGVLAMAMFSEPEQAPLPPPVATLFEPPSAETAPADAFGDAVRLGARLMTNTSTHAPQYVGNGLACSNCHLDAGRKAGAAPLWAAFVNFPAFRKKNGEINSFQKRVQDCFVYSMNGTPPPLGGRELLAIESYAAFMARGLPSGISPLGRGFPKLAPPALAADDSRGAKIYSEKCSACHGSDGAGQRLSADSVYPALWGPQSYNWGAGMATIDKAAAFIRANMPLGQEGSLTVQEAWDVANFIDGQVRPQDPRFSTSPQATRARHHDSPYSRYGTRVGGHLLGDPEKTPPAGGNR
ncbi:MAG: c-type cytochrome [Sphingorhabdus sp.]